MKTKRNTSRAQDITMRDSFFSPARLESNQTLESVVDEQVGRDAPTPRQFTPGNLSIMSPSMENTNGMNSFQLDNLDPLDGTAEFLW